MEINVFKTAGCEFNARDFHDSQKDFSHRNLAASLHGRQVLGAAT
jgi:hypothetical protein